MSKGFFLKGNICHTPSLGGLEITEDSYLLCRNVWSGHSIWGWTATESEVSTYGGIRYSDSP